MSKATELVSDRHISETDLWAILLSQRERLTNYRYYRKSNCKKIGPTGHFLIRKVC